MDLSPGRRTEPARPQDGRITLDFVEDIPGFHYSGISPARPHPGCTFVALTHASLKPKMGGIWEQTPLSGGREMFLRGSLRFSYPQPAWRRVISRFALVLPLMAVDAVMH